MADQVEPVRRRRRAPGIGGDPQNAGLDRYEDQGRHGHLKLFACSCRYRRTADARTGRVPSRNRTRHRYRACAEVRPTRSPLRRRAAELHGQTDQNGSDDSPTNQPRACLAAVVRAATGPAGQAVRDNHLECIDGYGE